MISWLLTYRCVQGSWSRDERGRERASREDLMMVLQNLDYILIKAGYDDNQDEVRSAFHTPLIAAFIGEVVPALRNSSLAQFIIFISAVTFYGFKFRSAF